MPIVPRLRREASSEADCNRHRYGNGNGNSDCNRNGDRNRHRYDDRNSDRHSNTGRLGFDNRRYDWATIGPRHDRALWHV